MHSYSTRATQVNDCIESSTHFQKNSEGLSRFVVLFAVVSLPQRCALATASQDHGRGL